jgi:hypothetical protein
MDTPEMRKIQLDGIRMARESQEGTVHGRPGDVGGGVSASPAPLIA